jgi:hypothetical protein
MSTHISRRTFAAFAFAVALSFATGVDAQQLAIDAQGQTVLRRPMPQGGVVDSLAFVRTELFFGTAKPDGVVTDAEFRAFIDRVVTPRFPDGLTIVEADGQFRGSDNVIIKEKSFVLILLYPVDTQRVSSRRIERIRELYKQQFQQQSVLRVDDPRAVRVSF